jgi:hypothetical protein
LEILNKLKFYKLNKLIKSIYKQSHTLDEVKNQSIESSLQQKIQQLQSVSSNNIQNDMEQNNNIEANFNNDDNIESIKKFSIFTPKFNLWAGGLIAIVSIIGVVGLLFMGQGNIPGLLPRDKVLTIERIAITPLSQGNIGTKTDSKFKLTTDIDLSVSDIEKVVQVYPNFDFQVVQEDDGYVIEPVQELEKDTFYRITIPKGSVIANIVIENDLEWNFFTEPIFDIVAMTPKNNAENVPATTAFEFDFNYSDIDIESFRNAFSIFPQVEIGEIKQTDNKLIVMPKNKLNPGAEYNIIIDDTVKRTNGEAISTSKSIYFIVEGKYRSEGNIYSYISIAGDMSMSSFKTFPDDKKLYFFVFDNSSDYKQANYKVSKIKRDKLDEALLILARKEELFNYDYRLPVEYLDQVSSGNFVPNMQNYNHAVEIKGLSKNDIYFVEFEYKGKVSIQYIYDSYIAARSIEFQNEVDIVAFNSEGKILENFKVTSFVQDKSNNYVIIKEDASGDNYKLTKDKYQKYYGSLIEHDGAVSPVINKQFYFDFNMPDYVFGVNESANYNHINNVFSYFKFDKPIYKYGDDIEIKTILKNSSNYFDFTPYDTKSVRYRISLGGQILETGIPNILNSDDGFVSIKTNLPRYYDDVLSRHGLVEILDQGKVIASKDFTVYMYIKPEATIDIIADDSKYYVAEEEIEIVIDAKDIAGYPKSNQNIEYVISKAVAYRYELLNGEFFTYVAGTADNNVLEKKTVKLDKNGQYKFKYKLPKIASEYDVYGIQFEVSLDKKFIAQKSFTVFEGDTVLTAKADSNNKYDVGENINVDIYSYNIQTKAKPKVSDIEINIVRVWSEKVVKGQRYDENTKQITDIIDYETKKEITSREKISLDNNGNFRLTKKFDKTGSYYFEIKHNDSNNRTVTNYQYVFGISANERQAQFDDTYFDYNFDIDKYSYNIGDEMNIKIRPMHSRAQNKDAYLIIAKDKEYYKQKISLEKKDISINLKIDEKFGPQSKIFLTYTNKIDVMLPEGVVNNSRSIMNYGINFSVKLDRELNTVINGLNSSYKPGEKVGFEFVVTDKNGKPVKNANTTIRIFDKALLYILRESNYKNSIYENIYDSYSPYNVSRIAPKGSDYGGGGMGDYGNNSFRSSFKDVALFEQELITDSSGKVKIEFVVPDNLTTWVVDAEVITKDLYVGSAIAEFASKKDYFINTSLPQFINVGDNMEIVLNMANFSGTDNKVNLKIDYTDNIELKEHNNQIILNDSSIESEVLKLSVVNNSLKYADITFGIYDEKGTLLDGIKSRINVYDKLIPSHQTLNGQVSPDSSNIAIEMPEDAQSTIGYLTLSSNMLDVSLTQKYIQGLYSLPQLQEVVLHNLGMLENYDLYSSEMAVSKEQLIEYLSLSIFKFSDFQDETTGGLTWFGYDGVDQEKTIIMSYIIKIAEKNNIVVDNNFKNSLKNYYNSLIINLNGEINQTTDINTKISAIWALSNIGEKQVVNYANIYANDIDKVNSATSIMLLSDAYLNLGSTGKSREIALNTLAFKSNYGDLNYLKDENTDINVFKDNKILNSLARLVYKEFNIDKQLENNILQWLVNNSNDISKIQNTMAFYTILGDLGNINSVQNNEIVVTYNNKEIYRGKFDKKLKLAIPNILPGKSNIEIKGVDSKLFYNLIVNYQQQSFIDSTAFEVNTNYSDLQSRNNLSLNNYGKVRITVKANQDVNGFVVKTYLPAGIRPVTWGVDFVYDNVIWEWMYNRKENNLQIGGAYIDNYLIFNGGKLNKGQTYTFEMLVLNQNKGQFTSQGTLVYDQTVNGVTKYEAGKLVEVK